MGFKKNILFATISAAILLTGCGSSSDSTIDPGGSGVVNLKAVDPYIVGAQFFYDVDNSGDYTTGDILSTLSDEYGNFSFDQQLTNAHNIIMRAGYEGTHLGVAFQGQLKTNIDNKDTDTGYIVATPLTSILANGISAQDLATVINEAFIDAQIPEITVNDLINDPMASISNVNASTVTDNDLIKIRAAIAAHQYVKVLNDIAESDPAKSALGYNITLNDLNSNENKEILKAITKIVKYGCNFDFINKSATAIDLGLDNALTIVGGLLNTTQKDDIKDILKLKVEDIAKTCVTIANYCSDQIVNEITTKGPGNLDTFINNLTMATSNTYVKDLGPRYYFQRVARDVNAYSGNETVKIVLGEALNRLNIAGSNGNISKSDIDNVSHFTIETVFPDK